ncbi:MULTISPECIES: hypothetical protein [Pseudomonas]|jgi:hypothetical protein|uniref:Uncharacterized protein n=1 Tax=Pseudomonas fluorescens TaxID=294 RepID=A0ABY1T8U5_PSEFL|nr:MULTISPECIES: hypothetical protein [Pseudomonas]MBC8782184.1 hypothetical protein [Pseudomonas fluorescens]MBK5546630.1 hypothetical protein [Pseudomonas sp. TH04]MCI4603356.1 hypothetical protein [Pseudomonas fluorescens]NNB68943.1 hypothetical protein [Pseudomonas fluorescens]OPB12228.1 hypothetical protein BFW91_10675 [Pseudomonas fluorescens]
MQFRKATKRLIPFLRNCLLVVCLIYIGGSWILSPGTPVLDEVVLKHSLGNGTSIYGARDGQGGATVGFSYRYYVHEDLGSDQEILAALVSAHAFLKTQEPDVQARDEGGALHLIIRGRVYEYHSYALEGLGTVKVMMAL